MINCFSIILNNFWSIENIITQMLDVEKLIQSIQTIIKEK